VEQHYRHIERRPGLGSEKLAETRSESLGFVEKSFVVNSREGPGEYMLSSTFTKWPRVARQKGTIISSAAKPSVELKNLLPWLRAFLATFQTFTTGKNGHGLEWASGTKDLLDHFHGPGCGCRCPFAILVGTGSNHSDWRFELVGRLSQLFPIGQGLHFSFTFSSASIDHPLASIRGAAG
jgi:hypothetical protein